MELKSLLLSSDEKTVRILRRVLSDLEIGLEHCATSEDAVHRLTRKRFEAIIVDCGKPEDSGNVLRASKSAPVNKRAVSIVLVEPPVGLKGGFEMGAHFVLHKPLAVERAKASFRAVRALMKSERRLQMRVAVHLPVLCGGSRRYPAKTLDLCEGGMAIQFTDRVPKESALLFSFDLPGMNQKLEIKGELAWEGHGDRAGVRFRDVTDSQRNALRDWLNRQLPECEPDDPPVVCHLTDLSLGGCYLTTTSPFPKSTRVVLSVRAANLEVRARGVVRLAHPEFGMGVEFLLTTPDQQDQVRNIIETLRAGGESPQLHVEPDGLEDVAHEQSEAGSSSTSSDDALVDLFRQQSHVPVDVFLHQMQQQRQIQESR
jgi:DNA-binding NarL/FixJ family response regulator